ncbi:hypothetical protein [Caulobacter segnis]|jgi:hypothetical protein|uniref:hypothetical protein n=1 Tax=Caulobacter segnis TaxID=88688 RepID=UPI001CBAD5FC|nr:hypothetical protein [Caulobacter segnis]UAL09042.1 hypothetical protein K8940_14705 [Caulobacter segnis]
MATYTIRIYNQSLVDKSYVVFMQAPIVTSNGGTTPIFTNAWATFENITNGGWDQVVYNQTSYAYWSQPAESLSPGVTIDSGGVMPVNTATTDTVTFTNTDVTGFNSLTSPGQAQNGSFQIVGGSDFSPLNNFVFGLASDNGGAIPSPVASFSAAPNETYNVTPVVQFYVADGAYTAGQVIDVTAVSSQNKLINFTGTPYTNATVVQGSNGLFTVNYD